MLLRVTAESPERSPDVTMLSADSGAAGIPGILVPPDGGAQELMRRAASMATSGRMDFNFIVLEKQHLAGVPSNIKCIFSSI